MMIILNDYEGHCNMEKSVMQYDMTLVHPVKSEVTNILYPGPWVVGRSERSGQTAAVNVVSKCPPLPKKAKDISINR